MKTFLIKYALAIIILLVIVIPACNPKQVPEGNKEDTKIKEMISYGLNSTVYSNQEMGFSINLPNKWQYDKEGSKEVTKQINTESNHQSKAAAFVDAGNNQVFQGMFIAVEPNKDIPSTDEDRNKNFQLLLEKFGNQSTKTRVMKVGEDVALRCTSSKSEYEGQVCFYHCTRIFTGEKMFEIVFLIPESFREQYENIFDKCVETFKVIR
jgi:hypothetical protein